MTNDYMNWNNWDNDQWREAKQAFIYTLLVLILLYIVIHIA